MSEFYVVRKQDGDIEHAGHKYIKRDMINGKWRYYYDYNDGQGNKVGVTTQKTKDGVSVSAFNTKADKYYRTHNKTKTKNYGPVQVEQAEDGTAVTLNISTKKIKAVSKKLKSKGKSFIDKLFK